MKHTKEFIYVLKLVHDKFYVGKTKNILNRVSIHNIKPSCSWLKKYKILDLEEVKESRGQFDEDNTTKTYMKKYGMDNVRGGSYTTMSLTKHQKVLLEKELRSSDDTCFKCGKYGHFSKECNSNKKKVVCFKCGKYGHYANSCYSRKHTYDDTSSCYSDNSYYSNTSSWYSD